MKKCSASRVVVLMGSLLGCQKIQIEPDTEQTEPFVKQEGCPSSMHFQLDCIGICFCEQLLLSLWK